MFFPLVASTTFGLDLIMSSQKVSWLLMQGFTVKYDLCEAEGGDLAENPRNNGGSKKKAKTGKGKTEDMPPKHIAQTMTGEKRQS